jgi:hypothetical protein
LADFELLLPFCVFLLHCSLSGFFSFFDLSDSFCWVLVTFSCKYIDFSILMRVIYFNFGCAVQVCMLSDACYRMGEAGQVVIT